MMRVRPFRPSDTPRLVEVCVRTADAGSDATGLLDDDRVWAEIFLLPYLDRHPDLAFVLEGADGLPAGYIVSTDDTRLFEEWFRTVWWPARAHRWPMPQSFETLQDQMIGYAYSRSGTDTPFVGYPAHLHIDLLPEAQRAGWGRVLIATLSEALLARGVTGLHAQVSTENKGALTFYPRVGFTELEPSVGSRAFGLKLASAEEWHPHR